MSYTIEYTRRVYFIPDEWDKRERDYILLIKQGDSNVFEDERPNIRVKDWYLEAFGWEYVLWERIGERAGATMGGSLQMANGFGSKWIDIEDYIKIYKKAIKEAKPIVQIFRDFAQISIYIEIRGDKEKHPTIDMIKDEYERERLKKYLEKYNLSLERETDYYGEKLAIRREIVTVQQLLDAIEHRMSYDGRRCFDILFTEKERETFSIPPLPEVS